MKKSILLLICLWFLPKNTQAQFKLSFRLKSDSLETSKPIKEEKNFFLKALKTLEKVREVLDDPSKIEVSLDTKKGEKESLKDFLRRKKLMRRDASIQYKEGLMIENWT